MADESSFISRTDVTKAQEAVKALYQFVVVVCTIASLPFEVLLRRQMGVRYLTFGVGFGSLALLAMFAVFGPTAENTIAKAASALAGRTSGGAWHVRQNPRPPVAEAEQLHPVFWAMMVVTLFALIAQFVLISRRQGKGIRCHSRYGGDSWPFWSRLPFFPGTYYWQYYFEPLLILVTGACLFPVYPVATAYFAMGGFGLWLKHNIAHKQFMNSVLDAIDAQIESRWASEYMSQWREPGAIATEGFVVPPFLQKQSQAEKLQFFATTAKLDPKLQNLLRKPAEVEEESGPPWSPWGRSTKPPGEGDADDPDEGGEDSPPPTPPKPQGSVAQGVGDPGGSLLTGDGPKPPTLPAWNPGGQPPQGPGASVMRNNEPSAPAQAESLLTGEGPRPPALPPWNPGTAPEPPRAPARECDPIMDSRGVVTRDKVTGEFRFEPLGKPPADDKA